MPSVWALLVLINLFYHHLKQKKWSLDNPDYSGEHEEWLFNLSCCRYFPNQSRGFPILKRLTEERGPFYGDDELCIKREPMNGTNNCFSLEKGPCFNIPRNDNG
jgi:hypothetical protein